MGELTTDALTYLGGSPTRVAALEELCDGPMSRSDLQQAIDTSRITLWRLLSEFEDRNWVRETGEGYEATAAGRLVVDQITNLRVALDTIDDLADVLEWFPLEEIDFGIERLADAEVVRPTPADPQRPMRFATRQIETTDTFRILTHGFSPWIIDMIYDRAMAGDQSGEMVTSPEVLEALIADPPIRAKLADLVSAGQLEYHQYPGPVPHILVLLDEGRVGLALDDDAGRPQAVFDIEDEIVRDWTERTFERYRSAATPVSHERFTE